MPGKRRARWTGPAVAAAILAAGYLLRRPAPAPIQAATIPSGQAAPLRAQDDIRAPERGLPAPTPKKTAPKPQPDPDPTLPFQLFESAEAAGLAHRHVKATVHPSVKNLEPWLSSVGAGAAVADYDGDGWQDVYFTNMSEGSSNRLYRNNHDGTFAETAAKAGLARLNKGRISMRPLFFDYDNDGDPDLFLTTNRCVSLYRNDKGRFADVTAASGLDHCGISWSANAIDYDQDGRLDLVVGDYYPRGDLDQPGPTDFMQNSIVSADNGGRLSVFHNDGGGRFSRPKGNLGLPEKGRWIMAVGVYDLDGNGAPDLYLTTDFNSDAVFLNDGKGRLRDVSKAVVDKYSRNGMSAEIADVDNDGKPAVYVTNIFEPLYKLGENTLWKWDGDKAVNIARDRKVSQCGWAWGAKFLDLDNDGRQDLVVANGYISANPKKSYWFSFATMSGAGAETISDARRWPAMGDASMSGYQEKCLFWNKGGAFENATARTGLREDRSDGRAFVAIDVMNDGSLSLIETNQGQPVRFYRNVQRNSNGWIGLKLVGSASNRDGFGAKVEVRLKDGRVLRRENEPGNGFVSQSDPRLHVGLGPTPGIEEVVVSWPSGKVQSLRGLAPGRYHAVKEPA